MHFYSIHVIAEYNLSGSEIICQQIVVTWVSNSQVSWGISGKSDIPTFIP